MTRRWLGTRRASEEVYFDQNRCDEPTMCPLVSHAAVDWGFFWYYRHGRFRSLNRRDMHCPCRGRMLSVHSPVTSAELGCCRRVRLCVSGSALREAWSWVRAGRVARCARGWTTHGNGATPTSPACLPSWRGLWLRCTPPCTRARTWPPTAGCWTRSPRSSTTKVPPPPPPGVTDAQLAARPRTYGLGRGAVQTRMSAQVDSRNVGSKRFAFGPAWCGSTPSGIEHGTASLALSEFPRISTGNSFPRDVLCKHNEQRRWSMVNKRKHRWYHVWMPAKHSVRG